MADGGRADSEQDTIERAARILAAAFGCGSSWASSVAYGKDFAEDGDFENHRALTVAERENRRGQKKYLERPMRSDDGKLAVHGLKQWRSFRFVATPTYRPHVDAIAALSFAKLDGPLEAFLLLYATGDVHKYWPTVERYALACVRSPFASEAVLDAVQRILCGRATISMDDRAKEFGVRATGYRQLSRSIEALMRKWLCRAAVQYLAAMG